MQHPSFFLRVLRFYMHESKRLYIPGLISRAAYKYSLTQVVTTSSVGVCHICCRFGMWAIFLPCGDVSKVSGCLSLSSLKSTEAALGQLSALKIASYPKTMDILQCGLKSVFGDTRVVFVTSAVSSFLILHLFPGSLSRFTTETCCPSTLTV